VGTVFLLHPPVGVGLSVLTPWCRTKQRHRLTIWQEGRDQAYEAIEAANQPAKSEEPRRAGTVPGIGRGWLSRVTACSMQ
jgi:hypothetical protein